MEIDGGVEVFHAEFVNGGENAADGVKCLLYEVF